MKSARGQWGLIGGKRRRADAYDDEPDSKEMVGEVVGAVGHADVKPDSGDEGQRATARAGGWGDAT